MKNWTIKKRIIAGFATTLVFVACLAVASHILLRQTKAEANFVKTGALPGLTTMARIRAQVSEVEIKVLRALLAATSEERKNVQDEIAAMRADILKDMDGYDKLCHVAEDREMFKQMEGCRDTYVAARDHLFELLNAGKKDEAMAS